MSLITNVVGDKRDFSVRRSLTFRAWSSLLLVGLGLPLGVLADPTVGLFLNTEEASEGYTLVAPLLSGETFLIDNGGRCVRFWVSSYTKPGRSAYLLEDGHLLRCSGLGDTSAFGFNAGAGMIEEFDWNGNRVWAFQYANDQYRQHHDMEKLPNGNVLLIAWERKTEAEAIAQGRRPDLLRSGELWPDHLVEVQPVYPNGGDIIWEWHLWDHLIQDYDPSKPNYGVVSDHPERVDLNYCGPPEDLIGVRDWTHTNSVDYNAELDQIVLSIHGFSEIWVLDHSTTTEEAAGHTGGRYGKGGDLLYRWGNPQAYRAGGPEDQQLFLQHDARWIEEGDPGEGHILIFNNGQCRPVEEYSTIEEIVPPIDGNGNYLWTPGTAYAPTDPVWIYVADPPTDFYASFISGAHRLPNGNTLICDGPRGRFFEVTAEGETVWIYVNPETSTGPVTQGDPIPRDEVSWGNAVFKVYRYAPDYPGLQGKDLTPGDPIEPYPFLDRIYVDGDNTTGPQYGFTWFSALGSVQEALDLSAETLRTQVWVAEGTYTPPVTGQRTATIELKEGVGLYGGFNGTETLRSERDPETNLTVLSGELGVFGDASDNAYHVLTGINASTVSGFTITGGNANGKTTHGKGGGLLNYHGASPEIVNCVFSGNAAEEGGAIYNYDGSSPEIFISTFLSNSAKRGGALVNRDGSNCHLTGCTFQQNEASWRGGAVFNDYGSSPQISSCDFVENVTDGNGGAIYNDDASSQIGATSPVITGCTFDGNIAALRGGAVANYNKSTPTILNCGFTNNSAGAGGGAISNGYYVVVTLGANSFSNNDGGSGEADVDTDATSQEQ